MKNQNSKKSEHSDIRDCRRKTRAGFGFAVVVILVGIAILLANILNFGEWNTFLFSWQFLIFFVGIIMLICRHYSNAFLCLGAGVFFLIPLLGELLNFYVPQDFYGKYWGVLVIYFGLFIFLHSRFWDNHRRNPYRWYLGRFPRRNFEEHNEKFKAEYFSQISEDRLFTHSATMADSKYLFMEEEFFGGIVNVSWGQFTLDLRKTDITSETCIVINVSFGNCILYLPPEWTLKSERSESFCGQIKDKRVFKENSNKILNLIGKVAFGEIEIRN